MKALEKLPKVSIIVTALDNEHTIGECLKSIFELDYPSELMEVLVVDGGSEDSTVKIVENYPVKLFVKPLNAPAAYNYALKMASADIVGFIDADAKVEKDWLRKLIVHLYDPKVAGASGTIKTWNYNSVLPRCIGYDMEYRYSRIKGETNRVATMNLLLKKSIIEEVGGFNENLPTQYETDPAVRITSRGYKIILEPAAKCYHFNRSTWRDYFKQQFKYGKNTLKLYLKMPQLIKGDAITDFSMNIQPILLVFSVLFALLGFFEGIFWSFSAILAAVLCAIFLFYAVKLAYLNRDPSALTLFAIYFVRAVAWTLGGLISLIRLLKSGA
ncbi:glycosyltransferase [Candidatus Bathyarchaeota archaeon]|nr:glycosyltransferase [Candidatus Bathyarchaeota archaeon]